MKYLITLHGSYLSGAAIVDALLGYGLALARRGEIDLVSIPFVAEGGAVRTLELMVGAGMDIAATSTGYDGDELVDPVIVAAIVARSAAIALPPPQTQHLGEVD